MKSYRNKAWYVKQNKIKLEEKWTTDLVAFIDWYCLWIEVKKDEKEYQAWLKNEERFLREWDLPLYLEREMCQIMEKQEILKAWWIHMLTYSVEHFSSEFEEFKILDKKSKKDWQEEWKNI